jgi:hypothetical protein
MAKLLIINDDYGQLAEAYYLKFRQEPASANVMFTEETPQFIPKTSLDTLLSSILKTRKLRTSRRRIVARTSDTV